MICGTSLPLDAFVQLASIYSQFGNNVSLPARLIIIIVGYETFVYISIWLYRYTTNFNDICTSSLYKKLVLIIYYIYYCNFFQYFKQSLGPRLSIVYLESWKEQDQLPGFQRVRDISTALKDFQDYLTRKLYKVDRDSSQLLT